MAAPTSLMIASFAELQQQKTLKPEDRFVFPAMAIPLGADSNTDCRFFNSFSEIDEEDVLVLLNDSYPMLDKIRRFHLISVPRREFANFNPGRIFHLTDS